MAGRKYTNLIRKMGTEAKRARVAARLKGEASPLTIVPRGTSDVRQAASHYAKNKTRLSPLGKEKRAAVAARLKEKASPGRPTGKNSKLVAGIRSRAQGRTASGGKIKATPTKKKK